MATNRRLVDFDGADFYPTPRWATEALLSKSLIHPRHSILEPCCGDGAISKVLEEQGHVVTSSDKFDRGYGTVKDAFDYNECFDVIITNPPFAIAEDLILHFLPLYNEQMCFLLRTAFLESASRYERIFSKMPPQVIYVFSERVSMYPKGHKGKMAGGTTSYAWFVWDRSYIVQSETRVKWIKPGYKPNSRRAK